MPHKEEVEEEKEKVRMGRGKGDLIYSQNNFKVGN